MRLILCVFFLNYNKMYILINNKKRKMKVLLKPFMLKKNILRLLILFLKNIIIFFDEDYDVNLNIGNNNNNNNPYIPPHYN